MPSIFYDLETTDKNPVGQILNYSFIAVDDHFEVIDELSGLIEISRLQLPRAGAILANRVDVVKHQQEAKHSEPKAMQAIASFIWKITEMGSGKVPFIGYNSSKFDLPYLRTSLIRNGIQPYFAGRLLYRDLLFLVRKLSVSDKSFPREPRSGAPERLSLTMETITSALGLLKGKQTHESRDDVLLTISLAKKLLDDFDLDVRSYEPYEVVSPPKKISASKPYILEALFPQYDLSEKKKALAKPFCLLDGGDSASLWIDLERFEEYGDRRAISYFHRNHNVFFVGRELSEDAQSKALAQKALKTLGDIKLSNFFGTPTCDIEQHIYRVHAGSFRPLEELEASIKTGDRNALSSNARSKDALVLFLRYQLREYQFGSDQDEQVKKMLKQYAEYRYGGKMQLRKYIDENSTPYEEDFHPTLDNLYEEIQQAREEGSKEDKILLKSLQQHYEDSLLVELLDDDMKQSASGI